MLGWNSTLFKRLRIIIETLRFLLIRLIVWFSFFFRRWFEYTQFIHVFHKSNTVIETSQRGEVVSRSREEFACTVRDALRRASTKQIRHS